jgi:phenylacetate-CoA ligase
VRKGYRGDGEERSLVLEGGILGRVDDMVVVRGVNVYPTAVESLIRSFDEIAEYQVVQTTVDAMAELKIVVEPVESVAEASQLAESVKGAMNHAFALRVPVEIAEPGSLPRYEFKSKRWIKQ